MQFSGALGNLIDRLRQGHVTDFISVGNFAVFNIADSCISVGTVILLIGMYLYDKREQQKNQPPDFKDNGGENLRQPITEESPGE